MTPPLVIGVRYLTDYVIDSVKLRVRVVLLILNIVVELYVAHKTSSHTLYPVIGQSLAN